MHIGTRTRPRLITLAAGAVLLLAACGGGDDGGAGDAAVGDSSADAPISTITMVDNAYEPADPVVTSGDVELVNDGESPHTFTVEDGSIDVEVEAGATATASIDLEPGTYTVFCEFHREQGMETTLSVR